LKDWHIVIEKASRLATLISAIGTSIFLQDLWFNSQIRFLDRLHPLWRKESLPESWSTASPTLPRPSAVPW
jgi:hypothetical protein